MPRRRKASLGDPFDRSPFRLVSNSAKLKSSRRPTDRGYPCAGSDQLILKVRVAGLRVGSPPPQVEEIFARYPVRGVIADGEPCLGAMRLVHIVRSAGSTGPLVRLGGRPPLTVTTILVAAPTATALNFGA